MGPRRSWIFPHDEDTGIRLIEKARALGVRNICVHKGLPFSQNSYEHSLASDIGIVAKRFPDVNFLVYHSGFVPGQPEGPYDPARGEGVDELIRSVEANSAAHIIGKLVKHIGEKNVLYGSDCIWYGSPQDQIQALRTFQISNEYQDKYGYAKITPELRAQIFGLNAAAVYSVELGEVLRTAQTDPIAQRREAYREDPDPHFQTFGPKTRSEFFSNLKARGGAAI